MNRKKHALVIQYVCLIVIAVLFALPLVWLLQASFDFNASPMIRFPEEPTLKNYFNVLTDPGI